MIDDNELHDAVRHEALEAARTFISWAREATSLPDQETHARCAAMLIDAAMEMYATAKMYASKKEESHD